MQDTERDFAAGGERSAEEHSGVVAPRRSRRRWSAEEKARVVHESFRAGNRVGEVARRYGVSRWQLSSWRGLARAGKLGVPSFSPSAAVTPEPPPAFATVEVDSAAVCGAMGSVVIEARGVTVRLAGEVGAGRIAEVAAALRGLR